MACSQPCESRPGTHSELPGDSRTNTDRRGSGGHTRPSATPARWQYVCSVSSCRCVTSSRIRPLLRAACSHMLDGLPGWHIPFEGDARLGVQKGCRSGRPMKERGRGEGGGHVESICPPTAPNVSALGNVAWDTTGMQSSVTRMNVAPYLPKRETNGTALQRLIAVDAICFAPAVDTAVAL